jgi:hypothetical protein
MEDIHGGTSWKFIRRLSKPLVVMAIIGILDVLLSFTLERFS